jgi:hypothetical protein
MPPEIRIYFEGDKSLRRGFGAFLRSLKESARAKRIRFELVSCGGEPWRDFGIGIRSLTEARNVPLVASEGPGDECGATQQGFPAGQVFWMVQMMEAWFHADENELERYYGSGFNRKALRPNPHVEQILRTDLADGLAVATRHSRKGQYHKTKHGPDLLGLIRADLVCEAAPNCRRLFEAVQARLAAL